MPSSEFSTFTNYINSYQIYLYFNCGLISCMYPLCIYLLFFTPVKLNAAYKYMLFGCATTSYFNSMLHCLWAPILTPGFFGAVITGIFGKVSREANLEFFQLALIALTNSQLCTVLLLVFQFSTLRPHSFLATFGRTSQRLLTTYFGYLTFIIAMAFFVVPTAFTSTAQFEQFVHQQQNGTFGNYQNGTFGNHQNGIFGNYQDGTFANHQNGTFGNNQNGTFAKDLLSSNLTILSFIASTNPTSYLFGTILILSSIFLFILGLHYTVVVSKVIKSTRGIVSTRTHKREIMMFKAFVFKTAMMFIFFVLPILVYTVSLWAKIQYPMVGMACNIVIVSHGSISYIGTICIIGPYRRIVFGLIFRIKPNLIQRTSTVVPSTTLSRSGIYVSNN